MQGAERVASVLRRAMRRHLVMSKSHAEAYKRVCRALRLRLLVAGALEAIRLSGSTWPEATRRSGD